MPLVRPFPAALAALVALLTAGFPSWAAADEIAVTSATIRQTIIELDSPSYGVRQQAGERIETWALEPGLSEPLARAIAGVLDSDCTSFEARSRLEPLALRLPRPPFEAHAFSSAEALGALLDRLASDSAAARAAAMWRVGRLLEHVEMIGPLLSELKARMAAAKTDTPLRRVLEPALELAREAWVSAPDGAVRLAPASQETITSAVEAYLAATSETGQESLREATRRDLLDLLVRDDTRAALVAEMEHRLRTASSAQLLGLTSLIELSRPALAAEVWNHNNDDWEHRQHWHLQYLMLGVPQHAEGSHNATLFDEVTSTFAHCASGNTLVEGWYPLEIAIGVPDAFQAMYHLISLPTPKARLAYDYSLRRSERERLVEITRRTMRHFVERKVVLDEAQILMLAQLDPQVVSEFAGSYFQAVPNRVLATSTGELSTQQTVHAAICYMLIRIGRSAAVPALEHIARSGKLGPPTYESPFQTPWIAALATATRDPWPEIDRWLAGLIGDKTPLVVSIDAAPELGASAAALLLARHGESPRSFGLDTANEGLAHRLQFPGYVFTSENSRQAVQQWWAQKKGAITP